MTEGNAPMTDTSPQASWRDGPPRRILLATDLSCRCDRAQDRAVLLAERWGAKLYVLHVLERPDPPEVPSWRRGRSAEAQIAERQIQADLQGRPVDHEVILATGEPAEAILRKAAELDCQLIVTGVARNEILGRSTLGDIVDQLAHRAPIPLLVVRSRPHRPYAEIVVATDFSEPSRHALECALSLFPDARITLFHAYHVPFEGFMGGDASQDEFRETAAAEGAAFLRRVQAPPGAIERVRTLIEYGSPDELLGAYVLDGLADLIVLGTEGRTGLSGFLVGSTAKRLLTSLPGDVLMVRGPAPPAAGSAAG